MVRLVPPFGSSVKATPVRISEMVCGELGAPSVTISVPARGPPTVGANATCIVHAVLTATVLPQVLLPGTIRKSPAITTLWTSSGTSPLLVSVTVCAAADIPPPVAGKGTVEKGEGDTPGG